uniref:hypothetical protein n=1 Tax=Cronobacter dublinensis TaxID=413497 RepID=UPI00374D7169
MLPHRTQRPAARVTDANSQTVWRGQFSTWGKTERELSVPQWQVPQNLRFQG